MNRNNTYIDIHETQPSFNSRVIFRWENTPALLRVGPHTINQIYVALNQESGNLLRRNLQNFPVFKEQLKIFVFIVFDF